MTITRIQANAAADLVRTIRPGWDAMATANVITELAETIPLAKVVAAAVLAASNPEYKSPVSIKWQELPTDTQHVGPAGKYANEPRCAVCGMRQTRCRYMCSKTSDRHAFRESG